MTEYAAGGYVTGSPVQITYDPARDGVLIPRHVVMELGAKARAKLFPTENGFAPREP